MVVWPSTVSDMHWDGCSTGARGLLLTSLAEHSEAVLYSDTVQRGTVGGLQRGAGDGGWMVHCTAPVAMTSSPGTGAGGWC